MSKRKGSSEEGRSSDPTMEVIQKDQCTSDTGLTTTEDTSPQELKQSETQKLIPSKHLRKMKSLQNDDVQLLLDNISNSASITTTATTTTTTICRTTAPAAIITTTSTITSTTTTTTPLGTVAVDRMGLSKMHKKE